MQFVTQNKQFVPRIFRGRLFVIEYAHEVRQNERQNKAKIQRRPERGMDGEDRMEGQKTGPVYLRRHGGAGSAVQSDAAVRCAGDIKLRRAPCPRGGAAGHHRAFYTGAVSDHGAEGVFQRDRHVPPCGRAFQHRRYDRQKMQHDLLLQYAGCEVHQAQGKGAQKHTEQQGSDGKHLGDPDQTAAERGRFSGVPCHPVQPELGAAGGDCCDLRGGISGVPAFQQLDFPAPG